MTEEVKNVGGVDAGRLASLIDRIERLEEEKKGLANDIKEVFAEAKSAGFDVKAMKQILKIRKMDESDRQEQEFIVDSYRNALGIH